MILSENFVRITGDNVKLMMTGCMIQELHNVGSAVEKTILVSKKLEREPCNHEGTLSADECIRLKVGK